MCKQIWVTEQILKLIPADTEEQLCPLLADKGNLSSDWLG